MKAFTVVTSPGADAPGREPTALTWLVMLGLTWLQLRLT